MLADQQYRFQNDHDIGKIQDPAGPVFGDQLQDEIAMEHVVEDTVKGLP